VTVVTGPLAGIRVLVVDDDEDTRIVLEEVLANLGARVTALGNAEDAIVAASDVDVVITDVAMPGVDGVWLLEQITALPRPMPVIAMSGYAERHVARFAQAPFARKLLKPVEGSQLTDVVCEILRARAGDIQGG
jgi:CheY-like chemotaxis protein